ncbi:cell wall hydrolase [Sphingobium sp. JS3065]|uniref:cell wall hydrolase n=1 Tax=Sphingobium sp. JS3065 TaxID=2970925 RepID=UPI002265496B|nr:cell wall hydrolase [Sphingobium sp. JS3065]UZW56869.1 cell wall hydrolase [Sphingobium sp. JS3065]
MIRAKGARQGVIAMLALVALAAPRLITAAPLDLLAISGTADDPAEKPGENFPGSAFFFAQGAFDPVPGTTRLHSRHVMALDAVQAAPAMAFRGLTALDGYRALNCLTSAIYYEAGSEPEDGQRAVAQVVLNRVRNPLWPKSVCGVVYQGSERTDYRCQFTFSCDGSMARMASAAGWTRARRIAAQALSGIVYRPVGLATYYHTLAVRPDWAAAMRPVAVIGAHIFYRPPGVDGAPAAFRAAYMGRETQSGPARPARPALGPAQGLPLPLAPFSTPTVPAAATPLPDAEPGLPQSAIRPEYRNSGRPLI